MGGFDSIFGGALLAQAQPGGWADTVDKAARTPQSTVVLVVAALTVLRIAIFAYSKNIPAHRRTGVYKLLQVIQEAFDAVVYAGIFVFLIIRPYFVQAFRIPSGSMVSTLLVNDFIVANKLIYRYTDPKDGDIVVFRPPPEAVTNDPTQTDPDGQVNVDFIKRCIGTPGQTIEIKNDELYRDGQHVTEPYKHFTHSLNPPEDTLFRELTPEEHANESKFDFKLVNYKGEYWPVYIEGNTINNETGRTAPKFFVGSNKPLADALRALPPVKVPDGFYLMMGDNRNGSYDGRSWGLVPRSEIVGRAEWIWLPLGRFGKIKSN